MGSIMPIMDVSGTLSAPYPQSWGRLRRSSSLKYLLCKYAGHIERGKNS